MSTTWIRLAAGDRAATESRLRCCSRRSASRLDRRLSTSTRMRSRPSRRHTSAERRPGPGIGYSSVAAHRACRMPSNRSMRRACAASRSSRGPPEYTGRRSSPPTTAAARARTSRPTVDRPASSSQITDRLTPMARATAAWVTPARRRRSRDSAAERRSARSKASSAAARSGPRGTPCRIAGPEVGTPTRSHLRMPHWNRWGLAADCVRMPQGITPSGAALDVDVEPGGSLRRSTRARSSRSNDRRPGPPTGRRVRPRRTTGAGARFRTRIVRR
jgi:hypothetical protein